MVDLVGDEDLDLVLITSDARLLHFPPRGPACRDAGPGAWRASSSPPMPVRSFGAIDVTAAADVVTVAGSSHPAAAADRL